MVYQSDAAGFPGDGNPPKNSISAAGFPDDLNNLYNAPSL